MAKTTAQNIVGDMVNTKLAVLILAISLLVFIAIGVAVGYFFFWGDGNPASKIDIDHRKGISQIKDDPENPQAHIDLGWVYMQKKQYVLAEREYLNALELEKNNAAGLYNLALLKVQTGKVDEAEKLLEKTKKVRPDYIKARATLGYVYVEKGQYDKALEEFKLVEKYYPANSDLMYQYGRLYEKKGDKAKAREYLNEALKLDPQNKKAREELKRL